YELRRAIRTFKLDRVIAAEMTNDRFDIPPGFNLNRLFSEAWGVVWRDTSPQTVELLFFNDTARIVQEAFWHPSQRVVAQQDGTCRVTFQVSEPNEMVAWIRQWGADVEVISPPKLREAIVADALRLAERYPELNTSAVHQST